jgi:hypothetical protein
MNSWQDIFQQSRVNRGTYVGDRLPAQHWQWPRNTWFQQRIRYLRKASGKYIPDLPPESLP